jgi:streptomycin 6-kinase
VAFEVSERLAAICAEAPDRGAWLAQIPGVIEELRVRWALSFEKVLLGSEVGASWVALVHQRGMPAVLKLGMPHMEAEDEIEGLRFWNGDPTAQLLEFDDGINAMLIERCKPVTLRTLPELEQDVVIARVLQKLWRVPPASFRFRPLSEMTAYWGDETRSRSDDWSDEGLVEEGLRLFDELPGTAEQQFLLATDLHAGNVLRAEREPWLVIDPKPFFGDPAYDGTQHLLNCMKRMLSDPTGTMERFADMAGIDPGRLHLWMFARAAAECRSNWNDGKMELARMLAP